MGRARTLHLQEKSRTAGVLCRVVQAGDRRQGGRVLHRRADREALDGVRHRRPAGARRPDQRAEALECEGQLHIGDDRLQPRGAGLVTAGEIAEFAGGALEGLILGIRRRIDDIPDRGAVIPEGGRDAIEGVGGRIDLEAVADAGVEMDGRIVFRPPPAIVGRRRGRRALDAAGIGALRRNIDDKRRRRRIRAEASAAVDRDAGGGRPRWSG